MESNVCKIKRGSVDLSPLLAETEKVAKYNELSGKKALALRLLAEELVSMLPSIAENYDGEFWITTDGDSYALCVEVSLDNMDALTRDRLIRVSKDNKNAAAVGISGKIRAVFDYMVMGGNDPMISPAGKYGFATNIDFSHIWSLKQYQAGVTADEAEKEKWDEFERSILVKLADDVEVGVKGKSVTITIKKTFQ